MAPRALTVPRPILEDRGDGRCICSTDASTEEQGDGAIMVVRFPQIKTNGTEAKLHNRGTRST